MKHESLITGIVVEPNKHKSCEGTLGWWRVKNSDDLVGDDVYGILRDAAHRVVVQYQTDMGRLPTRSEWERLLLDALQPNQNEDPARPMLSDDRRPVRICVMLENETDGG